MQPQKEGRQRTARDIQHDELDLWFQNALIERILEELSKRFQSRIATSSSADAKAIQGYFQEFNRYIANRQAIDWPVIAADISQIDGYFATDIRALLKTGMLPQEASASSSIPVSLNPSKPSVVFKDKEFEKLYDDLFQTKIDKQRQGFGSIPQYSTMTVEERSASERLVLSVRQQRFNHDELPSDLRGLQAQVYFIFQFHIEERAPVDVTPFFLLSWTKDFGLSIKVGGGKCAGLLKILDENLFRQASPKFYFAALMTSMALILSEREEERAALKLLLNAVFVGGAEYSAYSQLIPDARLMPIYAWLKNYLPISFVVTDNAEVDKAKTALEKNDMIIAGREISQPVSEIRITKLSSRADAGFEKVKINVARAALEYGEHVIGDSPNFSNRTPGIAVSQVETAFGDYAAWGVSNRVISLNGLIKWFLINESEGSEQSKFAEELVLLQGKIEKLLPNILPGESEGKVASCVPLVLNWYDLDAAAYEGTSSSSGKGQSAARFVQVIRKICPDGSAIFPGGKISMEAKEGKKVPAPLVNLMIVPDRDRHRFSNELQRFLDLHPKANPYTLATYHLCKSLQPHGITTKYSVLLRQYGEMLSALSFAVTNEDVEFPDLTEFMPVVSVDLLELKAVLDEVNRISDSAKDYVAVPRISVTSEKSEPRDHRVETDTAVIASRVEQRPCAESSNIASVLSFSPSGMFGGSVAKQRLPRRQQIGRIESSIELQIAKKIDSLPQDSQSQLLKKINAILDANVGDAAEEENDLFYVKVAKSCICELKLSIVTDKPNDELQSEKSLSQLLDDYCFAKEQQEKRLENNKDKVALAIKELFGPMHVLEEALQCFHGRFRLIDDAEVTKKAGHALPVGMEEIVKKIDDSSILDADILLFARDTAKAKLKSSSCFRKPETVEGYRCIFNYLSDAGNCGIKENKDANTFIDALKAASGPASSIRLRLS